MSVQGILLGPFYSDAAEYESKLVGMDASATCGDLVLELADHLGVAIKQLSLVARKGKNFVRLHNSEKPLPQMQVKGVSNLEDLPYDLVVKPRRRLSATVEEGLQMQQEMTVAYSDEIFTMVMENIRSECRKKWADEGEMNTKDYHQKMKPLLESAQRTVLPKWGYEVGPKGIMMMQEQLGVHRECDSFQDWVNAKLGFDFNWISGGDEDISGNLNHGSVGKLKMLYLYGGGCNKTVGKMQINNLFRESPMFSKMEFDIFEAPIETDLEWHRSDTMKQSLKPFGSTIYLYFDRMPHSDAQHESWGGIDVSLKKLKEYLKTNGPYDGVIGFDMGGEVLLQAACMAEEGDPGFKDMFRFMLLFTTSTAKHLSDLGKAGKRPKKSLKIPAIVSWSYSDENHSYTNFEETSLFFAPEFREVIVHEFGHLPPRFKKGMEELDRMTTFLEKMWGNEVWEPSKHPDNDWNRNLWLPLTRVLPVKIQNNKSRRLLVVHDPMGPHDYANTIAYSKALINHGAVPPPQDGIKFELQGISDDLASLNMNLEVSTLTLDSFTDKAGVSISVEGVEYNEDHRNHDWHCRADQVMNLRMKKEDIICGEAEHVYANNCAKTLLQNFVFADDDNVAIVGLGTGAFVAFEIAKHLIKEKHCPLAGVWLVNAPTRLPYQSTLMPGSLANCPVRYLIDATSTVGAPWRWEISTGGPFSMSMFETVDDMVSMVIDEYNVMCSGDEIEH